MDHGYLFNFYDVQRLVLLYRIFPLFQMSESSFLISLLKTLAVLFRHRNHLIKIRHVLTPYHRHMAVVLDVIFLDKDLRV